METKTISTTIQVAQISELSVADRELIEHAMRQTDKSYAPYSRFNVGAAVRLVDGSIIVGCNQENAAFGVTMCAERSALFAALTSQSPPSPLLHATQMVSPPSLSVRVVCAVKQ